MIVYVYVYTDPLSQHVTCTSLNGSKVQQGMAIQLHALSTIDTQITYIVNSKLKCMDAVLDNSPIHVSSLQCSERFCLSVALFSSKLSYLAYYVHL